ncbi:MAG: hypothetical protein LBV61_08525 [Burkholderiaceae bacterium]|jgi:hypothetical protein|nr:hypothetical protein [Burkholderiaceae bacterium]
MKNRLIVMLVVASTGLAGCLSATRVKEESWKQVDPPRVNAETALSQCHEAYVAQCEARLLSDCKSAIADYGYVAPDGRWGAAWACGQLGLADGAAPTGKNRQDILSFCFRSDSGSRPPRIWTDSRDACMRSKGYERQEVEKWYVPPHRPFPLM